ncbi:MAG TPA: DUF935 family protein [Flavobacterium alvei]|nr:DUF935 family protein [Flavobacterium alvei]
MANLFSKIFRFAANPKDSQLFFYTNNKKLYQRKKIPSNQNIRCILDDEEISSAFETRLDALIATPWALVGNDNENENDFIYEQIKKNLYCILNSAWWALPFGKSALQVVYKKPDPITKGITIDSVIDENPDNFEKIKGVWVLNKKPITEGKYFVTLNKPSAQYPDGFPLAIRLWDVYDLRCNGDVFMMKYLEKFGVPFFALSLGDNTGQAEIDKMKEFLESERPRGVILNKGSTIETVDGRTSSTPVFESFDQITCNRILRVILGQTLTSTSGSNGSYSLGQVHERVSWNKTYSDSIMVKDTVQAIVKTLYELNKFTGGVPTFEFQSPKGIQGDLADRDAVLSGIGVRFTQEYFVDQYDFDETQITYQEPPIASSAQPRFTSQLSAQKKRFISPEKFQARIGEAEKLENKFIGESINYGKEIAKIVKEGKSPEDIQAKLKAFIRKGTVDFDEALLEGMLKSSIAGAKDV